MEDGGYKEITSKALSLRCLQQQRKSKITQRMNGENRYPLISTYLWQMSFKQWIYFGFICKATCITYISADLYASKASGIIPYSDQVSSRSHSHHRHRVVCACALHRNLIQLCKEIKSENKQTKCCSASCKTSQNKP